MSDDTLEKLILCQARKFLTDPREVAEQRWKNWSDPKHKNYRGEKRLAKLREVIARLKNGNIPNTTDP